MCGHIFSKTTKYEWSWKGHLGSVTTTPCSRWHLIALWAEHWCLGCCHVQPIAVPTAICSYLWNFALKLQCRWAWLQSVSVLCPGLLLEHEWAGHSACSVAAGWSLAGNVHQNPWARSAPQSRCSLGSSAKWLELQFLSTVSADSYTAWRASVEPI